MLRLLPILAIATFGIAAVPQKGLPRGEDVSQYRTWKCITPEPVDMPLQIALSCVVPPSWNQAPSPHKDYVFKIYVNSAGAPAMTNAKAVTFPVGTIIVKEKFALGPSKKPWNEHKLPVDAKPQMLTVMTKQAKGFDTPNGDWSYQVFSGDMRKETSAGLEYCAKCHTHAASRDYVFFRKATKPMPAGGYEFIVAPATRPKL